MKGFTFFFKGKDVFFATERQRKTESLARDIVKGLINAGYDVPDDPEVLHDILHYIRKAECRTKEVKGNRYYSITTTTSTVFSPEDGVVIIRLER